MPRTKPKEARRNLRFLKRRVETRHRLRELRQEADASSTPATVLAS